MLNLKRPDPRIIGMTLLLAPMCIVVAIIGHDIFMRMTQEGRDAMWVSFVIGAPMLLGLSILMLCDIKDSTRK